MKVRGQFVFIRGECWKRSLRPRRARRTQHVGLSANFQFIQPATARPRLRVTADDIEARPGRIATGSRYKHPGGRVEMSRGELKTGGRRLPEVDHLAAHAPQTECDSRDNVGRSRPFIEADHDHGPPPLDPKLGKSGFSESQTSLLNRVAEVEVFATPSGWQRDGQFNERLDVSLPALRLKLRRRRIAFATASRSIPRFLIPQHRRERRPPLSGPRPIQFVQIDATHPIGRDERASCNAVIRLAQRGRQRKWTRSNLMPMHALAALRVTRREPSQMDAVRNRMGFAGTDVFTVMRLLDRITGQAVSRRQLPLLDRHSVRVVEQALTHFILSVQPMFLGGFK